jgi:hypothetical protein
MIAILDYEPRFCPNCGKVFPCNQDSHQDFNAYCSFVCPKCGACYQKATSTSILETAGANGGDLREL